MLLREGVRSGIRNNFFSKRTVRHWNSCLGSREVIIPGGAQEQRCGTEGCRQ